MLVLVWWLQRQGNERTASCISLLSFSLGLGTSFGDSSTRESRAERASGLLMALEERETCLIAKESRTNGCRRFLRCKKKPHPLSSLLSPLSSLSLKLFVVLLLFTAGHSQSILGDYSSLEGRRKKTNGLLACLLARLFVWYIPYYTTLSIGRVRGLSCHCNRRHLCVCESGHGTIGYIYVHTYVCKCEREAYRRVGILTLVFPRFFCFLLCCVGRVSALAD